MNDLDKHEKALVDRTLNALKAYSPNVSPLELAMNYVNGGQEYIRCPNVGERGIRVLVKHFKSKGFID